MNDIIYREATREDTEQLLLHLNTVGGETDNLSFGKDTFLISKEKEAKFIDRFSKSETDVRCRVRRKISARGSLRFQAKSRCK